MREHRLRYWHRWLGLGSLGFVILLSITGITLNHSSELQLDQRYVRAPWLLSWYGIEVPPVESSYAVAGHRVTLIGERLYFNERELADRVLALEGAVATPQFIAIAVHDSVLLLTRSGAFIERMALVGELVAGVQAIGTARTVLIVRSDDTLYEADKDLLRFEPYIGVSDSDVQWAEPSTVPPEHLETLHGVYSGTGVSVERLLADLHSGRLFTSAGPFVMDIVGIILIVLGVFGIMVWIRDNGNGRRT